MAVPSPGTMLFVAGLVGVALFRTVQLSGEPAPPGADGGDWLAFAWQLSGQPVRAAEAASPPTVPVLLLLLMQFVSPLVALKTVAIVSSVSAAVPFYFLGRQQLPSVPIALTALTFSVTAYHTETMAWGGYPQLLGTSFLLASALTFAEGLWVMRPSRIALSAVFAALTVATHQLAATELALAVPVLMLLMWMQLRPSPTHDLRRRAILVFHWAILAGGLSVVAVPSYAKMLSLAQAGTTNPQGYTSALEAAAYAFQDAPLLWGAIALLGTASCAIAFARRTASWLSLAALSLIVASVAIVLVRNEVRALYLFELAVMLAFAGGIATLYRDLAQSARGGTGTIPRMVLSSALCAALAALALRGYERGRDTIDYYTVVDGPVLQALSWLQINAPVDALVLAGQTPRDGPLAWWVEGIAKRPAYSTDVRFLRGYNSIEQEQIRFSARLLAESTSGPEAIDLIRSRRIAYLLIDKNAATEFSHIRAVVPMTTVFENQEIVILRPANT